MTKTLQEHFDYVVSNLLKQGSRSQNSAGDCLYRSFNGHKCAGGWAIPDDKYNKAMEMSRINYVAANFPDALPPELMTGPGMSMLGALQRIHDGFEVEDWPKCFSSTALIHGLSDAVCTAMLTPSSKQVERV
jgi:hypothetical protein